MKIKNCVRFLLAVLLLISGSTPVLAQTPAQCASEEPIRPGDTVSDAVSDVPAAHVDITEVETTLTGQRLKVVFHLRDLPETPALARLLPTVGFDDCVGLLYHHHVIGNTPHSEESIMVQSQFQDWAFHQMEGD
ncbi:MAG: hypothetical protein F4Y84_14520 [Caldilineaceae bacterium SB0665_bin_25]|nr:hypothetical protein [Caldilineaceae bacterium SB0665_bin_25]